MDETKPLRSKAQNASIHVMFDQVSAHCVAVGLDQKTVVSQLEAFSCPTSSQFVKDTWKAMQLAITGKASTKDLTTAEVDQVYAVFTKFWSEVTGEHFAFPSIEAMLHADESYYH